MGSRRPDDEDSSSIPSPTTTSWRTTSRATSTKPQKATRAAQACLLCRSRKVRCNAVAHGTPCSNCKLDQADCIFSIRKRPTGKRAADAETSSPSSEASKAETPIQTGRSVSLETPEQHKLEELALSCRISSALLQSTYKSLQPDRLALTDVTIQHYCSSLSRSITETKLQHQWKFEQLHSCINLIQFTRECAVKADEAIRSLEEGLWRLVSQLQLQQRGYQESSYLPSVRRSRVKKARKHTAPLPSPRPTVAAIAEHISHSSLKDLECFLSSHDEGREITDTTTNMRPETNVDIFDWIE
jgi:hypothetical protein